MSELHERLTDRQSTDELRRKQRKARRKGFFTQEDIDLAKREGSEMWRDIFGDEDRQ